MVDRLTDNGEIIEAGTSNSRLAHVRCARSEGQ